MAKKQKSKKEKEKSKDIKKPKNNKFYLRNI